MESDARLVQLIECLIHVIGRASMPVEKVCEIVGNGAKQVRAFNLCDGTRKQAEIVKSTGIEQASLSRSFKRWVASGAAFGVGEGSDARLLHIYPIPDSAVKAKGRANRARQ